MKKSPKKPTKPKKRSIKQRMRELEMAIERAFEDIDSHESFKKLSDDLIGQALTLLSIAEDKVDGVEPVIMWSDDPAVGLISTISTYSEFTKTPLTDLIGHTINNIPHVGEVFLWN